MKDHSIIILSFFLNFFWPNLIPRVLISNTWSSDRYRSATANASGTASSPTPAAAPVPEVKDVNLKGRPEKCL